MNALEETTLSLMEKNQRLTPDMLAERLSINLEKAKELCHWGWMQKARDCFYLRHFGMTMDQYLTGDHLDG